MNFFEKTFLDWKVMFDPIAARKPPQLKVASDAEAAMTPPTIGSKESRTGMLGVSPKNKLDSNTEKNGSIDCNRHSISKRYADADLQSTRGLSYYIFSHLYILLSLRLR